MFEFLLGTLNISTVIQKNTNKRQTRVHVEHVQDSFNMVNGHSGMKTTFETYSSFMFLIDMIFYLHHSVYFSFCCLLFYIKGSMP